MTGTLAADVIRTLLQPHCRCFHNQMPHGEVLRFPHLVYRQRDGGLDVAAIVEAFVKHYVRRGRIPSRGVLLRRLPG